jgi:hypothetical protein
MAWSVAAHGPGGRLAVGELHRGAGRHEYRHDRSLRDGDTSSVDGDRAARRGVGVNVEGRVVAERGCRVPGCRDADVHVANRVVRGAVAYGARQVGEHRAGDARLRELAVREADALVAGGHVDRRHHPGGALWLDRGVEDAATDQAARGPGPVDVVVVHRPGARRQLPVVLELAVTDEDLVAGALDGHAVVGVVSDLQIVNPDLVRGASERAESKWCMSTRITPHEDRLAWRLAARSVQMTMQRLSLGIGLGVSAYVA